MSVLTIGTFDGVHRGHQALLRHARSVARRVGGSHAGTGAGTVPSVVAVAFAVHPMACLAPARVPARLDTVEQRIAWLRDAGADVVETLDPTPALLGQEPAEFLGHLVRRHRPIAIVEGDDFHFGRRRAGSIETLRTLGAAMGFETHVVPPVEVALADHSVVAVRSTLVRWLLRHGRVADAARCLGRPFELSATIVPGDRRGRTIGFPTANLDLEDHGEGPRLVPAAGIYAGTAVLPDGRERLAAISIGTKPTFGTSALTCETHLLDHDAPVEEYGWSIRLRFARWLRDQIRYDGLEPLLAQMRRDLAATRGVGLESATVVST